MGNKEQPIDLSSLSQRELLILVATKVDAIEKKQGDHADKQRHLEIEMAVMREKVNRHSSVFGFIAGIIASLIVLLVEKLFK